MANTATVRTLLPSYGMPFNPAITKVPAQDIANNKTVTTYKAPAASKASYAAPAAPAYDPYSAYSAMLSQQMAREAQMLEQANSYVDMYYNQGRGELQRGEEKSLRESYIQNEQSKNGMQQVNAAFGNTGGLSESSLVRTNANYQNNRSEVAQHFSDLLGKLLSQANAMKSQNAMGSLSRQNDIQSRMTEIYANSMKDLPMQQVAKYTTAASNAAKGAGLGNLFSLFEDFMK